MSKTFPNEHPAGSGALGAAPASPGGPKPGPAEQVKVLDMTPETRALLLTLYRQHVGSASSLAKALDLEPRLPGACPHCHQPIERGRK